MRLYATAIIQPPLQLPVCLSLWPRRVVWLLLAAAFSGAAWVEAGVAEGQVASIHIANHAGYVLFDLDAEIKNSPRCNTRRKFAIDLGKPGGRAAYSALLEAKRGSFKVSVVGLNTCGVHLESEGVKTLEVQ
ncbi:hypothetical protein FKG94_02415 [Exilibacterium tricleocarpae]|uniref:Uncharacterized protein n=1 Tax=Exilibacterium tricleocarpae TaxID=2591008 RepID=A0A545U8C0_9GAMM|nr:hypothetical protein [Exilibacterium tricleocarpae]TQV85716.1 hypothetical protein FKG94_02415 [Exilibacterium tricleocarpae]